MDSLASFRFSPEHPTAGNRPHSKIGAFNLILVLNILVDSHLQDTNIQVAKKYYHSLFILHHNLSQWYVPM